MSSKTISRRDFLNGIALTAGSIAMMAAKWGQVVGQARHSLSALGHPGHRPTALRIWSATFGNGPQTGTMICPQAVRIIPKGRVAEIIKSCAEAPGPPEHGMSWPLRCVSLMHHKDKVMSLARAARRTDLTRDLAA